VKGSGWTIEFEHERKEYELEVSEAGIIELVSLDEEHGRLVVERVEGDRFEQEPAVFLSGSRLSIQNVDTWAIYRIEYLEQ